MFRRSKTRSQSVALPSNAGLLTSRSQSMVARSHSLPNFLHQRRVKGILKYSTVDDSLHNRYGESTSKDSDSEERRSIQFKDLIIREYARTVGDNPSCSSGPPISIAWEYDPESKIISVEEYEDRRPPRRTHFEMVLPRTVRQQMLRSEWNVSQSQIAAAVRNNIKVKNQRRATVNNLGKATKMEELLENCSKKVKRGLFLQKSVTREVEEMTRKLEEAERLRRTAIIVEENSEQKEVLTDEMDEASDSYQPQPVEEDEGDDDDVGDELDGENPAKDDNTKESAPPAEVACE